MNSELQPRKRGRPRKYADDAERMRFQRATESEEQRIQRLAANHARYQERCSRNVLYKTAIVGSDYEAPELHNIGGMEEQCAHCGARYVLGEARSTNGTFNR